MQASAAPDSLRAPRTGLDQATVAAEALDLLEERGLDALSIRALAARLDVSPMHLYRFFRDKEELLDLVTDTAVGADLAPAVDPGTDWREELSVALRGVWDRFRRYPEAARMVLARPSATPNGIRTMTGVIAILEKGGIPPDRALALYQLLRDFCMSSAVASARRDRHSLRRVIAQADPETRVLLDALEEGSLGDAEAQFEIGLSVLLAGLDGVFGSNQSGYSPRSGAR